MSSAAEHCRTVLAAIIPDRRDLLDKALRHLNPEHFPDETLRNLYLCLERYANATGWVLTRGALHDMLTGSTADAGRLALYLETYDLLAATPVEEAAFLWSVEQVRELAATRATVQALTQAMEILTRGTQDEHGEALHGHTDARHHVLQRFAEIDRDLSMQEAPEGDIRAEGDDILTTYVAGEAARVNGRSPGIDFGITELDAKLNGVQPGELVLLVGYTAEGKTHLAVQAAWNAAVIQGKNVVFMSTETVRETVRRRLVTRHSCLEHFGIDGGINSRDIKNFSLTPVQKQQLKAVVDDLSGNPGYGRLWIAQVPRRATLAHIESRLCRIQRMFPIDLVIIDSLYLIKAERRRNTYREELTDILKDAAQLGTTFNDGHGVPIISPWQVSRVARIEAEKVRGYHSSALSETAEASNSAHIIISLLAPMDNDQRQCAIRMQVMKNRDGENANAIDVNLDYATSRFGGQPHRGATMDDLWASNPLGA